MGKHRWDVMCSCEHWDVLWCPKCGAYMLRINGVNYYNTLKIPEATKNKHCGLKVELQVNSEKR
jgi:hypothetical protein